MATVSGRKRYMPSDSKPSGRNTKYARLQEARNLSTQRAGTAFENGELDVSKFVKAREFEIRALEEGIIRARGALSHRAFQEVPRDLRRRTASHDAKRVVKRLRSRARREMIEDNTPTNNKGSKKLSSKARLRLDTAARLRNLQGKTKRRKDAEEVLKKSSTGDDEIKKEVFRQRSSEASDSSPIKARKPKVKKFATLASPPISKSKFPKRQRHKTWLPTHMFHTKRAHMTEPKAPLWRFAIPLAPTSKCYRTTHRASVLRGAVAWDMSYMATIGLQGAEKSIEGLLKAIGVGSNSPIDHEMAWGKRGEKWRKGLRTWTGTLFERQKYPLGCIAPATVLWSVQQASVALNDATSSASDPKKPPRTAWIRVHPSGFLKLWQEVIRLAKVQKPEVSVEDLRFEIGSIEIAGPGATEALVASLWPSPDKLGSTGSEDSKELEDPNASGEPKKSSSSESAGDIWQTLGLLNNPSSLPTNALLSFTASDPRLRHPPRTLPIDESQEAQVQLLQTLSAWPVDNIKISSDLFDRKARLKASRELPSQKSINRRYALSEPGEFPSPQAKDPRIPVVLFATRCDTGAPGSWTLMCPWKHILPIWRSLMYYPLSSGGQVRFGGLNEYRQIAFEKGTAWFPGDFPGVQAGWEWEQQENEKDKAKWEARPKGKRLEFESLDLGHDPKGEIGHGWACDWQHLVSKTSCEREDPQSPVTHIPRAIAENFVHRSIPLPSPFPPESSIFTISITPLARGLVSRAARIYRLPTQDPALRSQWLALSNPHSKPKRRKSVAPPPSDAPAHVKRRFLALSLLTPQDESSEQPRVPAECDLIGFVTTGNYNLGAGMAGAIGSVLAVKAMGGDLDTSDDASEGRNEGQEKRPKARRLCIIRDSGQPVGRLAKWELA